MTDKDIENRIKKAFEAATPDVMDSILSDCKEQKGNVIAMTEKKKNPIIRKIVAIAAAFVILAAGAFGIFTYRMNNTVSSTISLDVNPSIEIKVNKNERVISVEPLNEDGRKVIGDMDFDGNDIDVTVNALIGSMLRNGYLSDIRNSILLTVDNDDPEKGAQLQERLVKAINEILQTDSFSGAVLSQTVGEDKEELETLADKYGISIGKARLINEIISKNSTHTFEELVSLSINDLNLMSETDAKKPENIESVGTASDKGYIGEAKAKAAALAGAGVKESDISNYEIDMDYEKGVMIYEIEFTANGFEYEYDINAITGEVVKDHIEKEDNIASAETASKPSSDRSSNTDIGKEKAKAIAFKHAGISAANAKEIEVDWDTENGVKIYEIEFKAGEYEYSYEINASTGAILSVDKEWDDDVVKTNTASAKSASATKAQTTTKSASYIGKDKAKSIALNNAGVSSSSIKEYEIELDRDGKSVVYEIEFKSGGYEYSYEINAYTGAIIDYDIERDDDYVKTAENTQTAVKTTTKAQNTTKSASYIGKDKAKSIALNNAGVSSSSVKEYEIELDRDGNSVVYEIEFKSGGYEYSYEINAYTGAIVDKDIESLANDD